VLPLAAAYLARRQREYLVVEVAGLIPKTVEIFPKTVEIFRREFDIFDADRLIDNAVSAC